MFQPFADSELAFSDYPYMDPEFPMSGYPVVAKSGESIIYGSMVLAGGPGPKGTVIICPPSDQSDVPETLTYPLVYSGINVLYYNARGTSREGTTYSLAKSVDDVHAILAWMKTNIDEGKTLDHSPATRLDPERIAVLGYGDGGNIGLAACAESRVVKSAIALGASNPDVQFTPAAIKSRADYRALKDATMGEIDLATVLSVMTPDEKARLSVIHHARNLAEKNLLLVGASADPHSPISLSHAPNVQALRAARARNLTEVVLDTDGRFLTKQYAVTELVISWLRNTCGF